jgi:hypothetical protein
LETASHLTATSDFRKCVSYKCKSRINNHTFPRQSHFVSCLCKRYFYQYGPGSSVSIATGYGLDGPGIESRRGGEIFHTCPDRPWGPPGLLYNRYWVFPRGKERPGRDANPSSSSSAVIMKGYSYTSTHPYGPFGLYRASVPVQGCTLPFTSFYQYLHTA